MSLKETQNPEDESGEGREDDVGGERKKGGGRGGRTRGGLMGDRNKTESRTAF